MAALEMEACCWDGCATPAEGWVLAFACSKALGQTAACMCGKYRAVRHGGQAAEQDGVCLHCMHPLC